MSVFLQPIYTQTVGSGGASSITFNNIPQTFTDLKVVISARGSNANIYTQLYMYINGDTSSTNYSSTLMQGTGTSSASYRESNMSRGSAGLIEGSTATSSTFGSSEIYIPNYSGSNYKSWMQDDVVENNATAAFLDIYANLWRNTAAITTLQFNAITGPTILQYSTFSLYGILRAGA